MTDPPVFSPVQFYRTFSARYPTDSHSHPSRGILVSHFSDEKTKALEESWEMFEYLGQVSLFSHGPVEPGDTEAKGFLRSFVKQSWTGEIAQTLLSSEGAGQPLW